jgi:2-isopropylmalate synthase
LISELAGKSSVQAKLQHRYPKLGDAAIVGAVLSEIQDREAQGYSYEAADASFDLLVRRHLGEWKPAFALHHYRVHGIGTEGATASLVEATVKLSVDGELRLCAAEGNGPVDALSHALYLALAPVFPELGRQKLVDYKVRVVNSADGTAAKVRVLIEHRYEDLRFATVGVSENIIEASWQALVDAIDCTVHRIFEQRNEST